MLRSVKAVGAHPADPELGSSENYGDNNYTLCPNKEDSCGGSLPVVVYDFLLVSLVFCAAPPAHPGKPLKHILAWC